MKEKNTNSPLGAGGIEERLWNFIDGSVSAEEKIIIEKMLINNPTWKARYQELLDINNLLQSTELETPSLRFSKNVMEEISKLHIAPATKSYINNNVIWGIGFFFIALFVGFLIYGFGQMDWTSGTESSISFDINKIDFSKFFNNNLVNAFMMINVVLGLFLLDNYLSSKRKSFKKEA